MYWKQQQQQLVLYMYTCVHATLLGRELWFLSSFMYVQNLQCVQEKVVLQVIAIYGNMLSGNRPYTQSKLWQHAAYIKRNLHTSEETLLPMATVQ